MLDAYRDFLFQDIYEFASLVEGCVVDPLTFIELGIEDDTSLIERLLKPHKLTLLHEYIFTMIRVWQSQDYRNNPDYYMDAAPERLRQIFEEYRLPLTVFPADEAHEDSYVFYKWFQENQESFFQYWEQVTDEVFHIVFANRRFLQRFGLSLAEYLTSELSDGSEARKMIGRRICRPGRYPMWLKTAVFHRDHGRCVFCMCDLSGLISTDRRVHLDHIVPLNRGGSNDPSNFQLLCEACNLEKSDRSSRAGRLYIPWWGY